MAYRIKELADLAGVSVRTLRHYDAIGLLGPRSRTATGYRLYGEAELIRLQQILFYRELDFELAEIGSMLDAPGFDPALALLDHRRLLEEKAARIGRLLATIDRTVARLGGEGIMLKDEELYEGFSKAEIEAIKTESRERWGRTEAYAESQRRVAAMGKAEWDRVRKEIGDIDAELAAALAAGQAPGSPAVQEITGRKYASLRHFYEPTPEMFAGLGGMYVDDERFAAHYRKLGAGLPEFLREAMRIYAEARSKA